MPVRFRPVPQSTSGARTWRASPARRVFRYGGGDASDGVWATISGSGRFPKPASGVRFLGCPQREPNDFGYLANVSEVKTLARAIGSATERSVTGPENQGTVMSRGGSIPPLPAAWKRGRVVRRPVANRESGQTPRRFDPCRFLNDEMAERLGSRLQPVPGEFDSRSRLHARKALLVERRLAKPKAAGSTPAARSTRGCGLVVGQRPSKSHTGVQFLSPAQKQHVGGRGMKGRKAPWPSEPADLKAGADVRGRGVGSAAVVGSKRRAPCRIRAPEA